MKKQCMIVLLSTEAEYIVQMHVVKEALWLCSFLQELCASPSDPLMINCDNQGAIALTKDSKFHAHTNHIDMCYHFIHEAVEDTKIMVQYILMDDNVTNIFTKPLVKMKFCHFIKLLGLQ